MIKLSKDSDFIKLRSDKLAEDAAHLKGELGYGPHLPASELELSLP